MVPPVVSQPMKKKKKNLQDEFGDAVKSFFLNLQLLALKLFKVKKLQLNTTRRQTLASFTSYIRVKAKQNAAWQLQYERELLSL